MADLQPRLNGFGVKFLKNDGDIKDRHVMPRHLNLDAVPSGVFASGYFENFYMTTAAASGYVLTSDGDGLGTWGVAASGVSTSDHSALSNLIWSTAGHVIDSNIVPDASGDQNVGTQAIAFNEVNAQTIRADTLHATDAYIGGDSLHVGGNTITADSSGAMVFTDVISGEKHLYDLLAAVASSSSGLITGEVKMWTTDTAPDEWLLCDGSSLLRAGTYADLFAVIGITYGSIDGTHFNIPDMRGRVPVGLDAENVNLAAADALGENGGEETHVLTEAELASHTHDLEKATRTSGGAGMKGSDLEDEVDDHGTGYSWSSALGGLHRVETIGSDTAHNNLQPYLTLSYIIKT